MSVGNPRLVNNLMRLLWLMQQRPPAVGCDGCQNQHVFNKSASTTFVDLHQTAVLNFSTGEYTRELVFHIEASSPNVYRCWCGPMYVNNCMQRVWIISEFGPAVGFVVWT